MEPGIDLNDLQCRRKEYSLFDQYAQSKLANILFALELGRRERNRRVEPPAAVAVAQGTRRKSASASPSPQPGGIKKKLLLPKLAPAAAAAAAENHEDEVGLGFDDIVTSPLSRARGHREEKIGPKLDKKKKKRLRPKLSPVTPEEGDDDDEVGLGFDDIVPSPSPGDGKKKKKKIRPKLRPSGSKSNHVEEKKQDDGGVGLGYGEIVPSPVVSESITSPRAVEEPVSKGETVRRGLTPTPSSKFSEEEETDSYLGFNGIASTPVTEDEGVGPGFDDIAPSPISKIEKSRRAKSSPGGKKTRRRLKPISPSKFAVDEEDETGLGFHDIVPTTPILKDGGTGVPSPAVSSAQKSRSKLAPVPLRADEETAPEKKARKRLTRVLSPKVAEEDGNSLDFEFNDIASTSVRQKRILVPLIIEDDGGDENEDEMQCEPSYEKGTASEATVEGKAFFPVQSYCLHPGLVRTDVVRDMPWYLYYPNMIFSIFLAPLQKSPSAGASCSVFCSVKDSKQFVDREGCYYVNSELQPLEKLALNVDDARKLWELSCKLVSIPMSNIDQGNTGL